LLFFSFFVKVINNNYFIYVLKIKWVDVREKEKRVEIPVLAKVIYQKTNNQVKQDLN